METEQRVNKAVLQKDNSLYFLVFIKKTKNKDQGHRCQWRQSSASTKRFSRNIKTFMYFLFKKHKKYKKHRLRAQMSMETEQRVNKAVILHCNNALDIIGGYTAVSEAGEGGGGGGGGGGSDGGAGGGDSAGIMARMYREERRRLLQGAIGQVEKCARISADMGVVVEALQDDWLDRQRHDLLRQVNNLGF